MIQKLAFGGGCHWCTEAVFQSLKGVSKVEQGYIASINEADSFSEAIIVHFNAEDIPIKVLIEIHLLTHKSTVNHSMRDKYRSAIYYFNAEDFSVLTLILDELKKASSETYITQILPFKSFKASREAIQNYYIKNPNKPFCKTYITPKLLQLTKKNIPII